MYKLIKLEDNVDELSLAIIRNLDPQFMNLEVSCFPIYVMSIQANNIMKYFVVCNHVCFLNF